FGEDAFHALWYKLINEYKPKNMLEIGVYRGQVISLWALVAKELNMTCEIHGISPFTSAGDEVSAYISNINYYEDVINNFNHFSLSLPKLHRGFSTDAKMIDVIKSRKWDVVYIDGSHDYDVVKSDFDICSSMLSSSGILIIDDSAVHTSFKPPIYSSAGHPGPSRLANEINKDVFKEILSVGHNRVFQKN
ncbi:class I SAM-dependent methyltransferase, partial [Gammaproteobacteria bacterium]|nr:class I SAM-dependent methyltransferase [Gammaproteobacteria bacterium]